jgi:zinc transporter ZupT
MLEAFGWGFLAQSSLLVAGLLVCWVKVPTKLVGILGGFGAGAMIAAVSFDLLPEGETDIESWQTGIWMLVGVAVFLLADAFVEKRFGSDGAGGAMGIVVGSVVDGVPESMILGIQVGGRPHDQSGLRRRRVHLEHSAGDRAIGRPRSKRLGSATAWPALVVRGPRLRSGRGSRLPGDRRQWCGAGRSR